MGKTPPPTSILDMILNHPMARLQPLEIRGIWSTPSLPLLPGVHENNGYEGVFNIPHCSSTGASRSDCLVTSRFVPLKRCSHIFLIYRSLCVLRLLSASLFRERPFPMVIYSWRYEKNILDKHNHWPYMVIYATLLNLHRLWVLSWITS